MIIGGLPSPPHRYPGPRVSSRGGDIRPRGGVFPRAVGRRTSPVPAESQVRGGDAYVGEELRGGGGLGGAGGRQAQRPGVVLPCRRGRALAQAAGQGKEGVRT